MKQTFQTLLLYPAVLLTTLFFAGCGGDDDVIPGQRTSIETYLNNIGDEYYISNGTYIYVRNTDRYDYDVSPVAATGDEVAFRFEARIFTNSPAAMPFYTNIPEIIAVMQAENIGLDPAYWPTEAIRAKLGSSPLMQPLTDGMTGNRQGDSISIFITSDKYFGDKITGALPVNSAVMFNISIEEVIGQPSN